MPNEKTFCPECKAVLTAMDVWGEKHAGCMKCGWWEPTRLQTSDLIGCGVVGLIVLFLVVGLIVGALR